MPFTVKTVQVADGTPQFSFTVECPGCGLDVWINTITRNPRERTYFCTNCQTIVPESTITEIIRYMDTHKPRAK